MQNAGGIFARWIDVEKLGRESKTIDIVASDSECTQMTGMLDVVEVSSFKLKGSLQRKKGSGIIELSATVTSGLVQACVVSLAPVAQKIEENFSMCYTSDKEAIVIEDTDYVVSMEESDLPELILEGKIDVVHTAVEQIALALDPYPRAEGVEESEIAGTLRDSEKAVEADTEEVYKPFANLKDLMNKK
ncbi:MAG: DUF177 domain-containing protein [Sneathiella sp.]|nr:DUF177 domain-containing protein [Sneathiella sp.]